MEENGLIVKDVTVQAEDSEKRQIVGMLKALEGDLAGLPILKGYHDSLMVKVKAEKLSLRSARLAMVPAKALLLEAQKMGLKKPDQRAVDVFLAKVPGQYAALTGFVRYLRESYSAEVVMPKSKEGVAQKVRQRKLEQEMLAIMRDGGDEEKICVGGRYCVWFISMGYRRRSADLFEQSGFWSMRSGLVLILFGMIKNIGYRAIVTTC
jgi:hypothetical protein